MEALDDKLEKASRRTSYLSVPFQDLSINYSNSLCYSQGFSSIVIENSLAFDSREIQRIQGCNRNIKDLVSNRVILLTSFIREFSSSGDVTSTSRSN